MTIHSSTDRFPACLVKYSLSQIYEKLHKGTSSREWRGGGWGYWRAVGCLKSSYTKISDMKWNEIRIYGPIKIITNINTLEWFATSLLWVKECYTHSHRISPSVHQSLTQLGVVIPGMNFRYFFSDRLMSRCKTKCLLIIHYPRDILHSMLKSKRSSTCLINEDEEWVDNGHIIHSSTNHYPCFLSHLSLQVYTCQATNGHVVPPKSTYAKLEMRRKYLR